ncbi:MAG: tetratricopeptide repeat protein, partial [Candidatus Eiseniibacteriota bacterium]
ALAAVVLVSALAPSWKSLGYDFVWDDPFLIGPQLAIHGPGDVARLWNQPFDLRLKDAAVGHTYFRPATLYSFAFDWAMSGAEPRGYHAQNLFWYALCCLFLWLLAWEWSGRPLAATAGAVLFALHPTHPESVCFVAGRTDLLAGAFLFAALWCAARFGPRTESPWAKLLPAALLLVPGMLAKEVALFGAPLLPLALWLKDRKENAVTIAKASAAVAAAVVLYLIARFAALGPTPLPSIAPVQGTIPQILTSVALVARYVKLLFVPIGLSARHEIAASTSPDTIFFLGMFALVAMTGSAALFAGRRSRWLLPLALFAATLLPVCAVRLLSGALVAERFLFVPSGALALAVALLVADRETQLYVWVATGAYAAWFVALLLPRVAIWRDEGTLYGSMLRDSPESPHVHGIIGDFYYRQRDLKKAAEHFRRSYELYPKSGVMLLNLGAAEDEMGMPDSAMAHIRLLNATEPSYGPGWYALGNLHARAGRPDSARIAYERAIQFMPHFAEAENNLGAVLEQAHRDDDAIAHYRRALEVQPGYPEASRNLNRLTAEMKARADSLGR